MLVLSRQRDESIMIGDNVEITIIDVRGDKVRLGITAPPKIPVHRKEIYELIKREGERGYKPKPPYEPSPPEHQRKYQKPGKLEKDASQA